MKFRHLAFFGTLLFCALLTGCGGGGSSGTEGPATMKVAGFVEDGPVAGARVFLVGGASETPLSLCGKAGTGACETESGADGSFSFTVPVEDLPAGAAVAAIGGRDGQTGMDFTDLELRSPLEMFSVPGATVTLSPVTTLVSARMEEGEPLELAQADVRHFLGLGDGKPLGARPSDDLDLEKNSLLLSKVALELKGTGDKKPFSRLSESIDLSSPLVAYGQVNDEILAVMGLGADAQARVAALFFALTKADGGLAAAFRREEIIEGISETLAAMLKDSDSFDPDDPACQQDVGLLADKILQAAGDSVIPLGGVVPQRLARYVLFAYNLASADTFHLDPAAFEGLLSREESGQPLLLENDPNIAKLAASNALYSVSVPLLAEELPGNDNQRRLKYYYNSDLSHLYQAEKVIGSVFDDSLSDAVMLEIVKGKAESGLLDDARTLIETQVFQAGAKGDGYLEYAQSLIKAKKYGPALSALHQAEELYRKIIEAEGAANISKDDVENLQWLAASYRKAGDLDASQAVLDYLGGLSTYISSYIAYGRLVTGTRDVADEYLDSGNLTEAAALVDSMLDFSRSIPANMQGGYSFYSLRVYYLVETAKRYAILGDRKDVVDIYNLIQALRAKDGLQNLTAGETWVYMPDLVEVLYRVGETQEALALADSIPVTFQNYLGTTKSGAFYQKKAFKLVATFEALNNGLDSALTVIDAHFILDTDKIEALTYFALNKETEYVALALIRNGRIGTAEEALVLATDLVSNLDEPSDRDRYVNMIQLGYVKIADLYHEAGDDARAADLLSMAQGVASGLTGAENIVDGLRDIALGYYQIGDAGKAASLLNLAVGQTDGLASQLTPKDSAGLYEALIQTYMDVHLPQAISPLLDSYVALSRSIFDPFGSYAGTDHDTLAGYEVDDLVQAASFYADIGEAGEGVELLSEATADADQIFTASKAVAKYLEIIGGYTRVDDFDSSLALASSLPYAADRYKALQAIAQNFAQRDDFPDTWVASIDTDKDGKPDFFNPLATSADIAASGLVLDDDSDGDGIPDTRDARPLYKDR